MSYEGDKKQNEDKFLELLKTADPELYNIKARAIELNLNLTILFYVQGAIQSILEGEKYGQVRILIEKGIVKFIEAENTRKVNESATNEPNNRLLE